MKYKHCLIMGLVFILIILNGCNKKVGTIGPPSLCQVNLEKVMCIGPSDSNIELSKIEPETELKILFYNKDIERTVTLSIPRCYDDNKNPVNPPAIDAELITLAPNETAEWIIHGIDISPAVCYFEVSDGEVLAKKPLVIMQKS